MLSKDLVFYNCIIFSKPTTEKLPVSNGGEAVKVEVVLIVSLWTSASNYVLQHNIYSWIQQEKDCESDRFRGQVDKQTSACCCCTYCISVASEPGSSLPDTSTGRGLSCCYCLVWTKYAAASERSLPYKQAREAARVHPLFIGWLVSYHEFESVFCCCVLFICSVE